MATGAQVSLNGRFPAGTVVQLVKVRDESVLRSEGGEVIDTKKVDRDGSVTFKTGVTAGGRYFIVGVANGFPLEVRARGNAADADTAGLQAPVQPDRQRLSDGSFLDEVPEGRDAPFGGVGPAPSLSQARGEQLRSDTPRGYAHPVEKAEPAPYPAQDTIADREAQRSATERGQATPVVHEAPASQSDVKKGTQQRSATPYGYATPVPSGDGVDAQRDRESAVTKAAVGEPVKAAANPPSVPLKAADRDRDPAVVGPFEPVPTELTGPEAAGDTSGLDPQGQPLSPDVAAAAGVDVADKPAEPVRRSRKK